MTTTPLPAAVAPYDRAARAYLGPGWSPIPIHAKNPPASGATGYSGTVTHAKILAWARGANRTQWNEDLGWYRLDNIAIRHDLTLALDVDQDYGDKNGVANLSAWAQRLGLPLLPATWSSTARGDNSPSRQYLYRISDRASLKTKPCTAVEVCNWHHRFTVCAPSIHPDTGSVYTWYEPGEPGVPPTWGRPSTAFPTPEHLPYLPTEWFGAFKGAVPNADRTAVVVDVPELLATFDPGEPDGLIQWLIEKWTNPAEHVGHDEFKDALIAALMLGREGHPGVVDLYAVLVERFTTYLSAARPSVAAKEVRELVEFCGRIAQQKPLKPLLAPGQMPTPRQFMTGDYRYAAMPAAVAVPAVIATTDQAPQMPYVGPVKGYRPPTKGSLRGLVKAVLNAAEPDRPRMVQWLGRKLEEHVTAGRLTPEAAAGIVRDTAVAAGLDTQVGAQ